MVAETTPGGSRNREKGELKGGREGEQTTRQTLVFVLETITETREVVLESVGILLENSVHTKNGSFSNL